MKRLPGVILFLLLILVILQIITLRVLDRAQKRITTLEQKVEALAAQPSTPAAPAK